MSNDPINGWRDATNIPDEMRGLAERTMWIDGQLYATQKADEEQKSYANNQHARSGNRDGVSNTTASNKAKSNTHPSCTRVKQVPKGQKCQLPNKSKPAKKTSAKEDQFTHLMFWVAIVFILGLLVGVLKILF